VFKVQDSKFSAGIFLLFRRLPGYDAPVDARRGFLLLSVGAAASGALAAYFALSSEISGTATVSVPRGSRSARIETVTRQDSPAQFRRATNFRWAVSLGCFSVGALVFTLYRKLDD
jgi:hypothetical protein